MKKIVLVLAIVFSGILTHAQVLVNDLSINDLEVDYVELVCSIKGQPTTSIVYVDYGQLDYVWEILPKNNPVQTIKDSEGNIVKKGNVVSALNLMTKNGWEFISSYTFNQTNTFQVRYLMKKK